MKTIIIKGLSKKFKIGFKKKKGLLSNIISTLTNRESKKIMWALKDVSFSVKAGEIVGVIGKNGSGKSTLLRIIAGIYQKDSGTITTKDQIISFIDLQAGLSQRLTMKENIFLICRLYGLDNITIKKIVNKIAHFAELEKYLNTKVYQFSSGMITRLAFSIGIFCVEYSNARIVLLDEVFSRGDIGFKLKGRKKAKEVLQNDFTSIVVSHSLTFIKDFCDRIILLEKGKIIDVGDPKKVIDKYWFKIHK